MAESGIFKPQTSTSGMGKKKTDDGQFANPPAYPDVSGFSGPSTIKDGDGTTLKLESSVGAKKGRV